MWHSLVEFLIIGLFEFLKMVLHEAYIQNSLSRELSQDEKQFHVNTTTMLRLTPFNETMELIYAKPLYP